MLGGIGGIAWKVGSWMKSAADYQEDRKRWQRAGMDQWSKDSRGPEPQKPARPKIAAVYGTIIVLAIMALVGLSGATQVPATHWAVVENTITGQFFDLGPGLHIWPIEPRLWPIGTNVSKYDLRPQIIEIGGQPVDEKGVQADSNSPGRPVVYFYARGWAYPNKEKIITLHRLYGTSYLDNWVERVWVSSLKATQGERAYDFVGNYRIQFQDLVEKELQKQLLDLDEGSIVFVSQLAIVDYDFSAEINAFLDQVAEKEFKQQQAQQDVRIAEQEQKAATIRAETLYIEKKRGAEATQAESIALAEGDAQATKTMAGGEADARKLLADADAYTIQAKYQAEADGITMVQQAVSQAPDYLTYQKQRVWGEGGADVPETLIIGLEGMVPFLDLLPGK